MHPLISTSEKGEFHLMSDDDSESSDSDDYEQSDVHFDGYDTESDDSTTMMTKTKGLRVF